MNAQFESVYPDFLRSGLGKLGQLDARRELLALFSALEHFRRDMHGQDNNSGILEVSYRYIAGLNLFSSLGFWLVEPKDLNFELLVAAPAANRPGLQATVNRAIKAGRFAFALRQCGPVFLQPAGGEDGERALLHSLAISSQVVGMFCGVLHREVAPAQEVAFSLLSLLLGESADAVATLRKTKQLASEVETLTSLLPLCAWCKKFRNDDGYWEQIEKYIAVHSNGTSITHGICPDCQKNFLKGLDKIEKIPAGVS